MVKALLFIGIGLAVVVAAILIFATTKPDSFSVQRTATIKAPPEKIFPLINDYRSWMSWSPWEKKDPAMKRTYSGAASGKGSVYEWEGNKEIGQGRMEIAEVSPPSHVAIDMHFIKPFDSFSTAEFTLQPKGDSTDVTWSMHGPNAYISKIITIFVSMDKMIGKEFETGLANLKTIAER
jgi:uncharacterized protein YndB with AHSA1/START domain